jgi:predicted dithiol-disulfide oxidoreductase (DUF899 family)
MPGEIKFPMKGEMVMPEKNTEFPMIFSHVKWAIDHKELPAEEEGTGKLNADRSKLSIADMDKIYVLEGPEGKVGLHDLFDGRNQLIVGFFMFDPNWEQGCSDCSAGADQISNDHLKYLHDRDTSFVYISRAPLAKIEAYKHRKGWSFPWYSSYGSDFNYDFGATTDWGEVPGGSVFRHDGGRIYHVTYNEAPAG